MSHIESHVEYEKGRRRETKLRAVSYLYLLANIVLGFFCLWEFAAAMRYVIGFSEDIYWLSRAWWQQISFIGVALLFIVMILLGQHLYEGALIKKGAKLPRSFVVITVCEAVFYAICRLITQFYF